MSALTAYLTSTNDSLVTTARQLASAAPASTATAASGQFARNATGWTELYSQGGNAALAGAEPAPSGHGFIWDVTTLEAKRILSGLWTPTIRLSAVATGFTVSAFVRVFRRSSSDVYTQLTVGGVPTDITIATALALTTTLTAHTAASPPTFDAMDFGVGDKLYVDVVLNVTTGSSSTTAANRVINLGENSGANDRVVTPGWTILTGAADSVAVSDSASSGTAQGRGATDVVAFADSAHANVAETRTAPSLVDHAVGYGAGPASTATTGAIDTTGATLLVAALAFNGSPTLTDSKGNTWSLADQSVTDLGVAIWYCRDPIVGPGHTFSLLADYPHLSVVAFRNIDVVAPLDAAEHVDATGGAASVHMPAVAARAYELIVTADGGVTGNGNTSIDEGFVLDDPGGGNYTPGVNWGLALAHKIVGPGQTVDPTWTDVEIHGAVLATFKPVPADVVTISDSARATVADARSAGQDVWATVESQYATWGAVGAAFDDWSDVAAMPPGDLVEIDDSASASVSSSSIPRGASDSLSISDAAARSAAHPRATADAVSISDAEVATGARARSASDAVGAFSDAATRTAAHGRTATDGFGVLDAATRAQAGVRGPSDSFSVADAASGRTAHTRSTSDAVGSILDAVSRTIARPRPAVDAVSFSDSASRAALTLQRGAADLIQVIDGTGRNVEIGRAYDEVVSLDHATTRQLAGSRTTVDAVSFSDAVARHPSLARSGSESISTADVATRGLADARTTNESVPIADGALAGLAAARNASDSLSVLDSAAGARSYYLFTYDLVAVADAADRGAALRRATDDLVAISDSSRAVATFRRSTDDVGAFLDSAARLYAAAGTAADSWTIADAIAAVYFPTRGITFRLVVEERIPGFAIAERTASLAIAERTARVEIVERTATLAVEEAFPGTLSIEEVS